MERAIGLLAAVCAVLALLPLFPDLCSGPGFDLIRPLAGAPSPAWGRRSGRGSTGGFH
nr:hypothetical protein [Anaerofilum sp. An201]